jgi:membrane-associated phospholipid phosphatase
MMARVSRASPFAAVRTGLEKPVLGGRMASWAPWVVLVLAGGIAVLALLAWRHRAPFGPELRLRDVLENDSESSPWTIIARISVPLSAAALGAVMIWTLYRGWYRAALVCAAVPVTIVIVEFVMKHLVGRRGTSGDLSFPSGHVALVAATVTVVLVAVELRRRNRSVQVIMLTGGAVACIGIVSTVIALEWHWPIDALAGLATGVVCSLGCCLLVDVVARRLPTTGRPRMSGRGHHHIPSARAVDVRGP